MVCLESLRGAFFIALLEHPLEKEQLWAVMATILTRTFGNSYCKNHCQLFTKPFARPGTESGSTRTRVAQFKKNWTGFAPRPGRATAAARAGAWFPSKRARKLQVPKRHTLCSHFSIFKHFKCPLHIQYRSKYF